MTPGKPGVREELLSGVRSPALSHQRARLVALLCAVVGWCGCAHSMATATRPGAGAPARWGAITPAECEVLLRSAMTWEPPPRRVLEPLRTSLLGLGGNGPPQEPGHQRSIFEGRGEAPDWLPHEPPEIGGAIVGRVLGGASDAAGTWTINVFAGDGTGCSDASELWAMTDDQGRFAILTPKDLLGGCALLQSPDGRARWVRFEGPSLCIGLEP